MKLTVCLPPDRYVVHLECASFQTTERGELVLMGKEGIVGVFPHGGWIYCYKMDKE